MDNVLIGHASDELDLDDGQELELTLKDVSVLDDDADDILEHRETASKREYEKAKAKDAKLKRNRVAEDGASLLDKYDSDDEGPQTRVDALVSNKKAKTESLAESLQRLEGQVEIGGVARAAVISDYMTEEEAFRPKDKKKEKKNKKEKKSKNATVDWGAFQEDEGAATSAPAPSTLAALLGRPATAAAEANSNAAGQSVALPGHNSNPSERVSGPGLAAVLAGEQRQQLRDTAYLAALNRANDRTAALWREPGADAAVEAGGAQSRLAQLRAKARGSSGEAPGTAPGTSAAVRPSQSIPRPTAPTVKVEPGIKAEAPAEDAGASLLDMLSAAVEEEPPQPLSQRAKVGGVEHAVEMAGYQRGEARARTSTLAEELLRVPEPAADTAAATGGVTGGAMVDEEEGWVDEEEEDKGTAGGDSAFLGHFSGNPYCMAKLLAAARERGYLDRERVAQYQGRAREGLVDDSIVYTDDKGRELSTKEAFRHMSYKFHGYGPSEAKLDRKLKKEQMIKTAQSEKARRAAIETLKRVKASPFIRISEDNIRPVNMNRKALLEYKQMMEEKAAKKQKKQENSRQ